MAASLVAAATAVAFHQNASATVRHVPSEYTTIQAAINASVAGDVVELADGIYTGPGNRNLTVNKNITVRSGGGDPSTCVIDCQHQTRGVTFVQTSRLAVLEGITVTNGHAVFGAGVYFLHSGTVRHCNITENHGNSANPFDGNGGGISCSNAGSPAIIDCLIQGNSAKSGGGIFTRSPFNTPTLIKNCTIVGNTASLSGGGVECSLGAMDVVDCLISDNVVGPPIPDFEINGGGGAFVFLGNTNMVNCTIAHNMLEPGPSQWPAGGAGVGISALSTNPSNLTMANCLLWGNGDNSTDQGGGLFNNGGTVTLANCTFALNTATLAGSAYHEVNTPAAMTSAIANSIVWGNANSDQLSQIQLDDANNANVISHSYIEGGLSAIGGLPPTWGAGNLGNEPDDSPQFIDPEHGDFHLASPAAASANAGDHSLVVLDTFDLDDDGIANELLPVDLDGRPRVVGCIDLGPFEHQEGACLQDLAGILGTPDGVVNVDDLLFLISMWAAGGGKADIAPGPCGNDVVNVDDLLAVLNGWGNCN